MNTVTLPMILLLASVASGGETKPASRYFPFFLPTYDSLSSFTDMSFLNPEPAGSLGPVSIEEGHFVDGRGERVRLLGSNLTFAGAFPPKDLAGPMAARMQKFGFNVIRFHHLDMTSAPRGIWLEDFSGIDPEQVDRLDWLIFQLKERGIYSNINLHVSRTYPGIPKDTPRAFRYGKGLDNFVPEFIELQKAYAKNLLTHVNPYTGNAYTEEPAVLAVEINNENALTNISWHDLRLMPEPFSDILQEKWNAWLRDRYKKTKKLRRRWDQGVEPLGEEMLGNRDFSQGVASWVFEQNEGGHLEAKTVDVEGEKALRVDTLSLGRRNWNLQVHQVGLDLTAGRIYTVSFYAKSDEPRSIGVNVRLDQPPWHMCGLNLQAPLTPEWRKFSYTFQCVNPEPNHCRVSFNLNNQIGAFWFSDVSLKPGGLMGLPEGQSIEEKNIPIPPGNATLAEREDFFLFLSEEERSYVRDMITFLKEEVSVRPSICCTQSSYGGIFGLLREGTLSDFVDMHAYWQHPHFPGKPWDGGNWTIGNTSMVESETGGTLARLSSYRVLGKPFSVSEYDHPAPSDFAAELFPMFSSFAAFQDWDAIYQFNYQSNIPDEEGPRLRGYFELWNHPGKLVFLPVASLMFRMGAVQSGESFCLLDLPVKGLSEMAASVGKELSLTQEERWRLAQNPLAVRLVNGSGPIEIQGDVPTESIWQSSTDEITWSSFEEENPLYAVVAPSVRVAVGKLKGKSLELGDVTLEIKEAEGGWACVAVAALDGEPLRTSEKVLVVAVGRVENTNMGWNEDRTSVGHHWGTAPILAEGIEGAIRLPGKGVVYALDERGNPREEVLSSGERGTSFQIGPEYQTLWYGVMPKRVTKGETEMFDFTDWESVRKEGRVVLVAHRGGMVEEDAPECSLEALRRAKSAGIDAVELDVRCSKDGVPILYHDPTLLDCGNGSPVGDFTARELTAMTFEGTDQHIATIEEALSLCSELGLGVQLDVKDNRNDDLMKGMMQQVAELVDAFGLGKSTVTISNGHPIVDAALEGKALFRMSPQAFDRLDQEGKEIPRGHYVFGHGKDLPDDLVKRMLDRGIMVMPSINTFHYLADPDFSRGGKDIARLQAAGVWAFQIDSGYLKAVQR